MFDFIKNGIKKYIAIGSTAQAEPKKEAEKLEPVAKSILEFWHISEVFSQEDYYADAKKDADNFKAVVKNNSCSAGKKKPKFLKNFIVLNLPPVITSKPAVSEKIEDRLKENAKAAGFRNWSDLTFYVGKISREACINKFAEFLEKTNPKIKELVDTRIEKNETKLAWFTFQLDAHGSYKQGSFSLSPNLWILSRLSQRSGFDAATLDKKIYDEANARLEKILAGEGLLENDSLPEEGEETSLQADGYPALAEDAIDEERIAKVCSLVYKDFVQPFLEASYKEYLADDYADKSYDVYCGISYKLCSSGEDVEDDNDYMPLFNSFFCDDLNLALQTLQNKAVTTVDLVNYITSAYSEMVHTPKNLKRSDVKRIDIVNSDHGELLRYLQYILDVEKAPLGKWPSEFSPSLTQQIAINNMVSIIERKDGFDEKNIFSVNGPPGTGKTTLLKEIIVHCIIEKANVLAQLNDPEQAFKPHKLSELYGEHVDTKCHLFNDKADKLNDYSILVTSCNNTAVENISKELPQQSKLLGDIKDEHIKDLFTVTLAEDSSAEVSPKPANEKADGKGSEQEATQMVKDVYFTDEAISLFDLRDEKGNPDIWGLIAAPLGKKKNINEFLWKALKKILQRYSKDGEGHDKNNFRDAATAYNLQRDKVLWLRKDLQECCRMARICTSEASVSEKDAAKKFLEKFKQKHEKVVYVDEGFVDRVLERFEPKGDEFYKGAQTQDPWFITEYDRQREKLLYCALRVIETFVLASFECQTNLKFLEALWTGKFAGQPLKFNATDKAVIARAAYQTLFLLVPVISSTFASVQRFFKDLPERNLFGLLIVDESGQAQPQMAVGSLLRARKAIIVGDPKQVEPVVTDELDILRRLFHEEKYTPYKDKTISVQRCADLINKIGTYMYDAENEQYEWLGCPLLVHRRCISPMFDISNEISYNGIMKKSTPVKNKPVIFEKSLWIEAAGAEIGNKNHFVEAHAAIVCELLDRAFANSYNDEDVSKHGNPSIYIISPFTSVVKGIKAFLKKKRPNYNMNNKIGTVHTFQGKEAAEVIFLLGCDNQKGSEGAIKWVNNNIVNVAATRAKNRFYVVAQFEDAWAKQGENGPVYKMYHILKDRQSVLSWEEVSNALKEKNCAASASSIREKHIADAVPVAKADCLKTDKQCSCVKKALALSKKELVCPICKTALRRVDGEESYWKCSSGKHSYADYNNAPVFQICDDCKKLYGVTRYILKRYSRYGSYFVCSNDDYMKQTKYTLEEGRFIPRKSKKK